jgi:hypothetical protein
MEISKNSRDMKSPESNGGYPDFFYGIGAFAIALDLILAGILH